MDSIYSELIGKYVICRSRNEGLNAGVVISADETGVLMGEARRLWYHKPAKQGASWYEAIANSGISSDSKISEPVAQKLIVEDYSLTLCSAEAEKSLREAIAHEN